MRALLNGDYFDVLADDDARMVRLVRSPKGFPSHQVIEDTFAQIEQAIASVPPGWALLIDTREGPLRNDPQFEELLGRARGRIVYRFARTAVLVQSAIGRLQVARYAREDRRSPSVFTDEAAAIAYLTT